MKKTVMVALLTAVSVSVFAQQKSKDFDPEERAQKHAERMKKDLDLTEKQYKQVIKMNEERAEHMKALREELKKEQKAYQEDLKAILTEEQLTKLEAQKKERRKKFKEYKHGGRGH
ncbi:hypothetical protein [Jiulongibacter sp. NS-SX5]|uniref:hypothetical protein n=1 Tax=Jiulongibacter sp. NS-SX5 TaxID=3463854 RepID=UPI004059AA81